MSVARSAATKVDWTGLANKLRPETVAALQAFRRRHTELNATVAELKAQLKEVDFEAYRKSLRNTAVVDETEKALKQFVPAKLDVTEQLKVIDAQETKAVLLAQKTAAKVNSEVTELNELLKNIESARPVEDLTVEDVVAAKPEILGKVQKMMERQQWGHPAYLEKFGQTGIGL
ncbi:hypothetical protein DFJ74DRAFT_689854 [Hyaloraphidium curvatum]|nr:hypothetical protein DFJ74DRAFT_689854 [Hyaloraphidium curvatum]